MTTTNPPTLKKYRLDNLFCADTGDFDIKKEHITGVGTDVVTAGETDNGILGKTDIQAKIFPGNTLTVDMFGNCVYRPDEYKLVTHSRVFSLKSQNQQFNEAIGLYMVAALKKLLRHFTYSNMCSWNKIKHFDISLPSTSAGEIDWAYMEQYITELEQQCIAELDQYLIVSGLNDCELTEEDKAVLAMKGTKPTKEFKVDDLFNISTIKQAKSQSLIPTDNQGVPYIVQSTRNNMCCRNVNEQWLIDHNESPVDGNCIVLGVTLPAISYQPDKFGASQVIIARANFLNEHIGIYCAELFKKQMNRFSYSAKPSIKAYKETLLPLPIQTDHNNIPFKDPFCQYHSKGYVPDWRFVENYIKAIKKVIIKDAVSWKNSIFY